MLVIRLEWLLEPGQPPTQLGMMMLEAKLAESPLQPPQPLAR